MITDVRFWEKSSGHRIRIDCLVNYLTNLVDLTIVFSAPLSKLLADDLCKIYSCDFHILEYDEVLDSECYGNRFAAYASTHDDFEIVIIEYIHCSYFLNYLNNDVVTILDAHDIVSERAILFAKYNYADSTLTMSRDQEAAIFNAFDFILFLSEDDVRTAKSFTVAKCICCKHPVEPISHEVRKDIKNVVFAASSYLPNKDGLLFFIEQCWPKLNKSGNLKLVVYGTISSLFHKDYGPTVKFMSFCKEVNTIYEDADIVINPVRFGAGLKIKSIEALAHGRPVISASHSIKGLEAFKGAGLFIADTADEYVKVYKQLLPTEYRKRLQKHTLDIIATDYDTLSCYKVLQSILHLP